MGRRFYDDAEETFRSLAANPDPGKPTHYQNYFLQGSRVFPMKRFDSHLVFYRPFGKGCVEIIDIVHGARDIENLY